MPEETIKNKLAELNLTNLYRSPKTITRLNNNYLEYNGSKLLSFSCNDYLGLSSNEEVLHQAFKIAQNYHSASPSSRLISGNHPLYDQLEEQLAKYLNYDAVCIFGSGYLANIGIIPALVNRQDLIIADKLIHASIIDGCILSRAKFTRFTHNNLQSCETLLKKYRDQYRNCLIITENTFSMDGDLAPLSPLKALANKYQASLYSDGAHNILSAPVADYQIGTLSKAFASYGGYIAANETVIDYLKSTARSLIYSTALPPIVIAQSIAALSYIIKNPTILLKPLKNAQLFTSLLNMPEATSQIVMLHCQTIEAANLIAVNLANEGFMVSAIKPPTVPTPRLRLTFSATHQERDIVRLASSINKHILNEPKTTY